jgi:hypothetical protein
MEELQKTQDTLCRLKLERENSTTRASTIDLYDPNSPEILQKKLSMSLF